MTVVDSRPAEAAASVTTRLVPALVDGNEIHIPCPSWCSLDHTAEDPRHIVDLYHFGNFADLEMPRIGTSPVLLAFARLGLDPFSSNPRHREPYLYVEDGGGGADGYQRRSEAQQFGHNLMAFAQRVLELSEQLPE